jgi:hypothetical protein
MAGTVITIITITAPSAALHGTAAESIVIATRSVPAATAAAA